MRDQLKEPAEYLVKLEALRKVNRYAKRWTLRLESHTNRHPECSGRSWGWYEIHPLGIEVGFWGSDKDDLKGVTLPLGMKKPNASVEPPNTDFDPNDFGQASDLLTSREW